MEADNAGFTRLVECCHAWTGTVAVCEKVNSENVERLLEEHRLPHEFDLLSINIGGNGYWAWSAIRRWLPRVVVMGYDAMYAPPRPYVPKETTVQMPQSIESSGASLASLTELARQKGYALVATDSSGSSAFFVRADLTAGRFLDTEIQYHYSRATGARIAGK